MGSQGTITAGKIGDGPGLATLMSAYSAASGLGNSIGGQSGKGSQSTGFDAKNPSQSAMPEITAPEFGDSAMGRRAEANNNHPDSLIANGLKLLDDPENGMDFQTRMAYVEPLLQAVHFGGPKPTTFQPGGEGKVSDGKLTDKSGLGNLMGVVSAAEAIA